MALKVKLQPDIDRYLVYFSFLEMLFLRWLLIGQDTIIALYCGLLVCRLLLVPRGYRRTLGMNAVLLSATIFFIVLNAVFREGFESSVFLKNLNYMFYPAVVIFYFGYLTSCKPALLEDVFSRLRRPLNLYYAVNVAVIWLQRGETYFLMPVSRIENNYYPDHMAGLLGVEGTHRLALVTVFVVLLNLHHLQKNGGLSPRKKLLGWGYLVFVVATAFVVSAINDNNMVFVLLPLIVVLYLMAGFRNTKRHLYWAMLICAAALVGVYLLFCTPLLSLFGNVRISSILNSFFKAFRGEGTGDERMRYLFLVFEDYHGLGLGTGFGSLRMRRDPEIVALGYIYRNWGMCDMAPFLAMGGLGFYIWSLYLYARLLTGKQELKKLRKYFAVIILILTYYHQVLTHATMAIPMCWILAVFALNRLRLRSVNAGSLHKDRC